MMKITVYDKDRIFMGQVGAPLKLTVTPRRFPLIGNAVMVLPLESGVTDADRQAHADLITALRAPSARVVFRKEGQPTPDLSGFVDEVVVDSDSETLEVLVLADESLLFAILGWQVPTALIANQGTTEYKTYTGVAETAVKNLVRDNGVTRLAIPGLVVAADQARGATILGGVSVRMHPIPDRIYPALDMAGICLTLRQVGADLVFDVYVPRQYPITLSVEGRTVKQSRHTRKRPTMSRVVIGGPGEAKLRRYRALTDTNLESVWGFCGEGFRDARDALDDSEPENVAATHATMDARGWETLSEAGKIDGLSITLAESTAFTYGVDGILVGDQVNVNIRGQVITDTVNEAILEWVSPDYVSVAPMIGERIDSASQTQKNIAALKESQRREERS